MKYIYYYIWLALAKLHPYEVKILYPINWIIMKLFNKSKKDYDEWRYNYSKAMLEFHGGIKDMFAFSIFVLELLKTWKISGVAMDENLLKIRILTQI